MGDKKPLALQLCPLSDHLENQLASRLEIVPWHSLSATERESLMRDREGECRAVVTGGHVGCPSDLMEQLPALGLVAVNGVGVDKVDLALAADRGVAVSNTPDVLTEDVADLAVGLVIALRRNLVAADTHVRGGHWPAGDMPLGRRVSGSRFGVLGMGRIGRAIADRLAPFGPVAYTATAPKDCPFEFAPSPVELARRSDIVIVACSASKATNGLVDAAVIDALGPEGILVNVARGSVVDEPALCRALEEKRIGGAALDVFANEPAVPDALRASSRTVLSPHIGSGTQEARHAMAELVLANIDAFLAGQPLKTPVG